jgi:death on curing protein
VTPWRWIDKAALLALHDESLADLAACYGVGVAKNPAFVDGNKRAAFLSVGLCLAINGHRLVATQANATLTMLAVAAGDMDEAQFADWIRQRAAPRS